MVRLGIVVRVLGVSIIIVASLRTGLGLMIGIRTLLPLYLVSVVLLWIGGVLKGLDIRRMETAIEVYDQDKS
ncbi:MAG: hypothetical protein ABGW78_00920 [Pirellulales bacterium]